MEMSFVEMSRYMNKDGEEFFEHLGLFKQHKAYYVMTYVP